MNAPAKQHYVDQVSVPDWGEAPDGRLIKIGADDRLHALFRDWQSDACQHGRTAIVRRDDSLGRAQYYEHCADCGLTLSSAIAHGKVGTLSDLTADDVQLLSDAYEEERRSRLTKIKNDAAERCGDPSSHDRIAYQDYLRSDTWKRRAAKIRDRANGTCEGCLSNPVDEVHHLTYEHIYNEFAFELVALCRSCHQRVHEKSVA